MDLHIHIHVHIHRDDDGNERVVVDRIHQATDAIDDMARGEDAATSCQEE